MAIATDVSIPGWFTAGSDRYPVRTGNRVTAQVDGFESFAEITRMLRTAQQPGHFIYLAGWWTQIDFELVPGDNTSTLRSLLGTAAQRGVQIRALLWSGHGPMASDNATASTFLNGLTSGGAILDRRHLNAGSHHQKIVAVSGSEGLLASCGGLDIDDNRLHSGPMIKGYPDGSPMHDASCTVTGPAAYDFVQTIVERWSDHPDSAAIDRQKGGLLGAQIAVPAATGDMVVQVGHTYGNGLTHLGIPGDTSYGGYAFAPRGRQSARDMILHAIDSAKRFIYMEDQYMVSEEVRDYLLAALPRIEQLNLVITTDDYVKGLFEIGPGLPFHRRTFLEPLLTSPYGQKVHAFVLDPALGEHTYVHSKVWIFDDELAMIGSVNCNRRSLTHDSEVLASIWDPSHAFARNLRTRLWSEHLKVDASQLTDAVASQRYWSQPPQGARIKGYTLSTSTTRDQTAWDVARDPDGNGSWERSLPDCGYAVTSVLATADANYAACNGHVYRLDQTTGDVLNHNPLPGRGNAEIRLASGQRGLYAGILGYVVGLDAGGLQTTWQASLPDSGYAVVSVVEAAGALYAASNGHTYRLDPASGRVLQHNPMRGRGNAEIRLAAGYGRVFAGTNGYVVGLDANGLGTSWQTSLPGSGYGVVTVHASSSGLFAGSNGHLYRLDPSNGNVLGHNPLPGRGNNEIRLAEGDGRLFAGISGYVVAASLQDVRTLFECSLPDSGFDVVSVQARPGTVWAGSNGHVYALGPADGYILRHNPLLLQGNHEVRLMPGAQRLLVGTWGAALGLDSMRIKLPGAQRVAAV